MSFDRMNQMDWTYERGVTQAQRGTIVGQVMGLLAFSLMFTAGGSSSDRRWARPA